MFLVSDDCTIHFGNKNAIHVASQLINEIYKINVPEKEGTKTTYNVGIFEGGTSVNTIAQNAKFLCEYRSDDVECLAFMESEFKRIFACSFLYNDEGEAIWPGVAVDYTAKTQFLFKINKGILSIRDNKKVNESQMEEKKRIPFPHMIYFGDGETDVPCMKIVKMFGGNSIAVYNPNIPRKKNTARRLLRQQRVNFITPADYTKESRTYQVVCSIIDKIKIDFDLANLARFK